MAKYNEQSNVLYYVKQCVKRNKDARKPLEYRWYENAAFAAGYTNGNTCSKFYT